MSRKILLSAAMLFAIMFVGFAEEKEEVEDAVVVADAAEEAKEEVAETATANEEAKDDAVEEAKSEEVVVSEEKEEAVKEAVEKTEDAPATIAEPVKEKAVEEAIEKAEEAETAPLVEAEEVKPVEAEAETENVAEEKEQEPSKAESCVGRALLLWLPNRLIDLTDIISMDGGVGSEIAIEAYLTKYFGLGGSFGEKYFIQKGYAKQFGGGYSSGWELQTLWMNTEKRIIEDTFGSTKRCYVSRKDYTVADYHNHSYTDKVRDFWAIGVKAGWLAIVGVEIHPSEIADFVAGIFFMDICEDDLK